MSSKKRIAIIGAGFSGLSAAAYSAQRGYDVSVFEMHDQAGGRARQFSTDNGYVFDMGPSWYWMPDVVDHFFKDFGYKASDFFELVSLDPQFEMIFSDGKFIVPSSFEELKKSFEKLEQGAGNRIDQFMQSAKYKYEIAMRDFVYKPCYSWLEFISIKVAGYVLKLDLFTNFRRYVSRYFSHPWLKAMMEFPVIFLGSSPKNIPALYSMMNYGGYVLGTKYPMGGFYQLVQAMKKVAERQGVKFYFNKKVEKISDNKGLVKYIRINGEEYEFDAVIASSDYHHTESLLEPQKRNYSEGYWNSKTFAPSCLIFYLGIKEKIPNLNHHTLFFEHDLDEHMDAIYKEKKWPEKPLFYCCCPSKTDPIVAPPGHENLFLLMPLATGLTVEEHLKDRYLKEMINRIEKHTGSSNLLEKIDYQKSYCMDNFIADYHSFKGNAYGLANTLSQTAVLKPKINNKKLKNLFYTGHLTVPGPGVPPSIISGKIVALEVHKIINTLS